MVRALKVPPKVCASALEDGAAKDAGTVLARTTAWPTLDMACVTRGTPPACADRNGPEKRVSSAVACVAGMGVSFLIAMATVFAPTEPATATSASQESLATLRF